MTQPMLIAHITDPHLGLPPGFLPGHPGTLASLRAALAHVRALQPAPQALLLTGDLAEAGHQADYRALHALLNETLPAPADGGPQVLCVPGNHDAPDTARRVLGAAMPVAADAPAGKACVRAAVGGLHFIGLDTTVPGQPHGALDTAQLHWLAAQLRALAGQPVLIFMHHPPLLTGMSVMDSYGLREGVAGLARLVAAHGGVQLIAAGHMHRPIAGALGGAPVVVAPSPSHQLTLDLRPGAPLACQLEPPMIGLYRWQPGAGITCHFSHVQAFAGPFPV